MSPAVPTEVAVRARNVGFDTSNSPLHWIPGDPYASHGISVFNLLLPTGERWFCGVYQRALPYVRDELIREEMLGFMGQEAMHAQSHDKVLHSFFHEHGVERPDRFALALARFESKFYPLLDRLAGNVLLWALKPQICVIAMIEHLTALLGDWMLNADELHRSGADPVILDLFRWHSAEEIEHRCVAYNVAEYFGIKRYQRALAAIVIGMIYEPIMLYGTRAVYNDDPGLPKIGYLRAVREWRKSAKRGCMPPFGLVFRQIPVLLSKHYSPAHVGNTAQALAYLAQSPAVREHSA